jgi:hypothetical protein
MVQQLLTIAAKFQTNDKQTIRFEATAEMLCTKQRHTILLGWRKNDQKNVWGFRFQRPGIFLFTFCLFFPLFHLEIQNPFSNKQTNKNTCPCLLYEYS